MIPYSKRWLYSSGSATVNWPSDPPLYTLSGALMVTSIGVSDIVTVVICSRGALIIRSPISKTPWLACIAVTLYADLAGTSTASFAICESGSMVTSL